MPCTTTDPELWHSRSSRDRALAVALCRECPLRQECAQYALDRPELRGVWGATTAADRRGFATGRPHRLDEQRRLRPACGLVSAYYTHFAYREQPCGECAAAWADHLLAERRARLESEHARGGSALGYGLHRRIGEPACADCLAAVRARNAASRQRRARRGLQRPRTASPASGSTAVLPGAQAGARGFAAAS
ncbi:WhiB family transcriptional regulator [Streptomyces sp. NPDC048241]|uniref:WhiB family transcriptional regulator n=1 Tax=Streptomyces sp. NPDC048241 TaxID=3365521 RepID=UPI003720A098